MTVLHAVAPEPEFEQGLMFNIEVNRIPYIAYTGSKGEAIVNGEPYEPAEGDVIKTVQYHRIPQTGRKVVVAGKDATFAAIADPLQPPEILEVVRDGKVLGE